MWTSNVHLVNTITTLLLIFILFKEKQRGCPLLLFLIVNKQLCYSRQNKNVTINSYFSCSPIWNLAINTFSHPQCTYSFNMFHSQSHSRFIKFRKSNNLFKLQMHSFLFKRPIIIYIISTLDKNSIQVKSQRAFCAQWWSSWLSTAHRLSNVD